MKKVLFVSLMIVATMFVASCASSAPAEAAPAPAAASDDGDMPDWFLNPPPYEGSIVGIGMSTLANQATALQQAETRARVSVAQTLDANVKAMVTDYSKSAGSGDNQTDLGFFESISQTLTQAKVTGAIVKQRAFKGGKAYVLVTLSAAEAKQILQGAADAAGALAEFNAMGALDRMDEQLAKADVKPAAVTE
jgi:hypothetical protein